MSISSASIFKLTTYNTVNNLTAIKLIGTRPSVCFKRINNIKSRFKLTSSQASLYTHRLTSTSAASSVHCVRPDSTGNSISSPLEEEKDNSGDDSRFLEIDGGGGDEGGSSFGGGDDGNEGDNEDVKEFGRPILKFENVIKEAEAIEAELFFYMMEVAKSNGLRKLFLLRYLDLQVGFF